MKLTLLRVVLVCMICISIVFLGVISTGCREEVAPEEEVIAGEEASETVEEDTTEEEVVEEEAEEEIPRNEDGDIISIAAVEYLQFACYQNRIFAAEMAAADYGVEFVVISPIEVSVESSVEALTNTINQDFDAIIFEPWMTEPWEEPLRLAQDKGIPMVVVQVPYEHEDMVISQIIIDNEQYGKDAAQIVFEETDGKANILFMMTNPDMLNQATQKASFEAAIAELSPDLKIVATEFTMADAVQSAERLEASFVAYPEIDVVIFVESGGVVVAASVAKEMGVLDDIMILGIDDPPDLIESIRIGEVWGSLNQNFSREGYEAVRNICDYYLGNPFPIFTDAGVVLITQDNVENYEEDMFGPIAKKGKAYQNLD